MDDLTDGAGPILRLFHVQTKPGFAETLLANFGTTSADVVQNEPGNLGYFYGRGVAKDDGVVIFVSVWKDLAAIKSRFGENWQVSFLPDGYDDMIESCSIQHINIAGGWHADL